MLIKTVIIIFQSFAPVFIGCIGGLYIYQAMHTPSPIFTRKECWTIGVIAILAGFAMSLNNHYHWVR